MGLKAIIPLMVPFAVLLAALNSAATADRFDGAVSFYGFGMFCLLFCLTREWTALPKPLRQAACLAQSLAIAISLCRLFSLDEFVDRGLGYVRPLAAYLWALEAPHYHIPVGTISLPDLSLLSSVCTGLANVDLSTWRIFGSSREDSGIVRAAKIFGTVTAALSLFVVQAGDAIKASPAPESTPPPPPSVVQARDATQVSRAPESTPSPLSVVQAGDATQASPAPESTPPPPPVDQARDAIKASRAPESTPPPLSVVQAGDATKASPAPESTTPPPFVVQARDATKASPAPESTTPPPFVVQARDATKASRAPEATPPAPVAANGSDARKSREAEGEARRRGAVAVRRRAAAEQATREEGERRMRQAEEEEKARQRREAEAEAHRSREAQEQALRKEAARKARGLEVEARRRRAAAREEEMARKQREAAQQAARIAELRRQQELAGEAARNAALQKQREEEERLAREHQAALEMATSQREQAEAGEEMDAQATGAALGVGFAPETEMGDDGDDARAQALKKEEEEEEERARARDVEMADGPMPEPSAFGPVPEPAGPPAVPAPAPQRRKAIPKPFSARSRPHRQSAATRAQNTTPRPDLAPRAATTTTTAHDDTEYRPLRERVAAPGPSQPRRQDAPPQGADAAEEDLAPTKRPAVTFVEPTNVTEAELLHRPAFRDRGVPVTWVPQGNSNLAFKTTAISREIEAWYQDLYQWFYSLAKRAQAPSAAEAQEQSQLDTELRIKMIERTADIDTILAFYSDHANVDLFAAPTAPAAIYDNTVRKLSQLAPPKGPLLKKLVHQPTAALPHASLESKRQAAAEGIKTVCRKITEVQTSIERFLPLVARVNRGNRALQCMEPAYSRGWKAKDEEWKDRQGEVFAAWKAEGDVWARLGEGDRMEG